MTREQIITRVKHSSMYIDDRETADYIINALEQQSCNCVSLEVYKQVMRERDIAIEQLKELGYDFGQNIRTSEDCVSRAEAIEAITEWWSDTLENTIIEKDPIDVLNSLPPVTPTRKVGKWIQISGGCKCPFCDMAFSRLKEDCSDNFCPECGADMRGESNNG